MPLTGEMPQLDAGIKRCISILTLVGMIAAGLVAFGGWMATGYKNTVVWKELKDAKDLLHDKSMTDTEAFVHELKVYRETEAEKQRRLDETNRALCAAGKLVKYWCTTQGFEWKTMEE